MAVTEPAYNVRHAYIPTYELSKPSSPFAKNAAAKVVKISIRQQEFFKKICCNWNDGVREVKIGMVQFGLTLTAPYAEKAPGYRIR